MAEPTAFEVFAYMQKTNNSALRLAPLSNIDAVNYNHKKGTAVTIGFPGNITQEFIDGGLIGGLLLVQRSEFDKAKTEMMAEVGL